MSQESDDCMSRSSNNSGVSSSLLTQQNAQIQEQQQNQQVYQQINYEFIKFDQNQNQICYVDELIKDKKQKISMQNLEQLDLLELSEALLDLENNTIIQTQKNLSIEQITRNQLKLIQKFGTVELPSKISKKTGLYGKEEDEGNKALANYYDTNDPFIDDELIDDGLKEFQTFESNYEDYNCCYGNLNQLLKSEHYQKRIEELKQIRTFKQEENQIYVDNCTNNSNQKPKKQQRKKKEKQQQQQQQQQVGQTPSSTSQRNTALENQIPKILSLSPESNHQSQQQQSKAIINFNNQKKKSNITKNKISQNNDENQQKKKSSTSTSSSSNNISNKENYDINQIEQCQENSNFEHLKNKRKRKDTQNIQFEQHQTQQQQLQGSFVDIVTTSSSNSFSRTNNFKIMKK